MAQKKFSRYDEQMTSGEAGQAYTYTQQRSFEYPYKKLDRKNSAQTTYSPFQRAVIMRGMKLCSVIVTVFLFAVLWMAFYPKNTDNRLLDFFGTDFITSMEWVTWVLYAILVIQLGRLYHAYEAGITKVSEIVYSQALANLFGGAIIFILACLTRHYIMNPLPLLVMVVAQGVWSVMWGIAANKLYFCMYLPQKTAVIYKDATNLQKITQIRFFSSRFDVQKQVENPDNIYTVIQEIDGNEVVFAVGIDAALRDKIVNFCIKEGIQCYVAPHVNDIVMAGAEYMQMFNTPIMRVHQASPSPEYLFIKRAFDIVGSLIGIIIASPFMIITALAIKVYDGGPVLYKQVRLTQERRKFVMLKFRSMCPDAEKDGIARLAGACDGRITPVGRVIRAIRFDEFPQLFNILRGDMTIVGPRPERPEIAEQYEDVMPEFGLRLQVKAGLTGYAQVYGKYNTEPKDKLQMDLMYINNMSLIMDMRLIFATVKILFLPESTEGVDVGQVTALDYENEANRTEKWEKRDEHWAD